MIPIRDTIQSRHVPIVTRTLIAVNILVFGLEVVLPESALESVFYHFGIVPARFTHPRWARAVGFPAHDVWPFFTSMFLHGGFTHVLTNMWSLWIFGDNVEDRMGGPRFFLFYIVCGLAAGGLHYLTNPGSTVPTVGASGAIAGVMGAYLLFFPRSRIVTLIPIFILPIFVKIPAAVFLVLWFASQFFSGAMSLLGPAAGGGIAWWAHVGGFAAGLLFCAPFQRHGAARVFDDERELRDEWRRAH